MDWLIHVGGGILFVLLGAESIAGLIVFNKLEHDSAKGFVAVSVFVALILIWIWICLKFI